MLVNHFRTSTRRDLDARSATKAAKKAMRDARSGIRRNPGGALCFRRSTTGEIVASATSPRSFTNELLRRAEALDSPRPAAMRKAFPLYLEAANAGSSDAQNIVGESYRDGLGVGRNLKQAVEWFRAAAAGGSRTGALNVGWAYQHGEGVRANPRLSAKLYESAADKGELRAMLNL